MTDKVINVKHAICHANGLIDYYFSADTSYADWCVIVRAREAMMTGRQAASKADINE